MNTNPIKPLAELVHAYIGRPAVVIGGGVSAPEQVARAPQNAVFISANHHGCLIRKCDFIVAADSIENREFATPDGKKRLRDFGVPIISGRRPLANYRIFKPPINNSGVLAAWGAWVLGCAPVILAGMDCYVGGIYFHDKAAQSTGKHVPLSGHLGKWRDLARHAPGGMFRTMGGTLAVHRVFPLYDPEEPVTLPTITDEALHCARGERVRVVKSWRLAPFRFKPGDEIDVSHGELVRGLREKTIQRIAA